MKNEQYPLTESIRKSSREMVRELGMLGDLYGKLLPTNSQSHILVELGRGVPMGVQDLAAVLRLEKSTVSRVLEGMVKKNWVKLVVDKADKRKRWVQLTKQGTEVLAKVDTTANSRVAEALQLLSPSERSTLEAGLGFYANALRRARLEREVVVRVVRASDDPTLAKVIRKVMYDFGVRGDGFACNDPEVEWISKAYSKPRCRYFVAEIGGKIVGGGGVAPLDGGDSDTCELKKMYLSAEARGHGVGRLVLDRCLTAAKEFAFKNIYLETLHSMKAANRMYESYGFQPLAEPLGNTGHTSCDRWMLKKLLGNH